MLKPVVEQCSDGSVNIFLRDLHFKLSSFGARNSREWHVWNGNRFELIDSRRVRRRLTALWTKKLRSLDSPPGPIPRFPRTRGERIKNLLTLAKKANRRGDIKKLGLITDDLKITISQESDVHIEGWKDIPLASEAPEQALRWLAKGRIPLKQVTVIAAAKDSYKSMLMLALVKALTTGGEFLGVPVEKRRVLYLNRDMPKPVFDNYCTTLDLDKSNSRFKILSSLWGTKIQPMEVDDPVLKEFAKRYHPVIIIDHLAKFCRRLDKPSEVDEFTGKLKQLAALGATVIVLHHVPKNDEKSEGFGSVYIINGVDFGWNINRRGSPYGPSEQTVLEIQNTKTKMGDYFRLKVRPLLSSKGMFEVFSEESREKDSFD